MIKAMRTNVVMLGVVASMTTSMTLADKPLEQRFPDSFANSARDWIPASSVVVVECASLQQAAEAFIASDFAATFPADEFEMMLLAMPLKRYRSVPDMIADNTSMDAANASLINLLPDGPTVFAVSAFEGGKDAAPNDETYQLDFVRSFGWMVVSTFESPEAATTFVDDGIPLFTMDSGTPGNGGYRREEIDVGGRRATRFVPSDVMVEVMKEEFVAEFEGDDEIPVDDATTDLTMEIMTQAISFVAMTSGPLAIVCSNSALLERRLDPDAVPADFLSSHDDLRAIDAAVPMGDLRLTLLPGEISTFIEGSSEYMMVHGMARGIIARNFGQVGAMAASIGFVGQDESRRVANAPAQLALDAVMLMPSGKIGASRIFDSSTVVEDALPREVDPASEMVGRISLNLDPLPQVTRRAIDTTEQFSGPLQNDFGPAAFEYTTQLKRAFDDTIFMWGTVEDDDDGARRLSREWRLDVEDFGVAESLLGRMEYVTDVDFREYRDATIMQPAGPDNPKPIHLNPERMFVGSRSGMDAAIDRMRDPQRAGWSDSELLASVSDFTGGRPVTSWFYIDAYAVPEIRFASAWQPFLDGLEEARRAAAAELGETLSTGDEDEAIEPDLAELVAAGVLDPEAFFRAIGDVIVWTESTDVGLELHIRMLESPHPMDY